MSERESPKCPWCGAEMGKPTIQYFAQICENDGSRKDWNKGFCICQNQECRARSPVVYAAGEEKTADKAIEAAYAAIWKENYNEL